MRGAARHGTRRYLPRAVAQAAVRHREGNRITPVRRAEYCAQAHHLRAEPPGIEIFGIRRLTQQSHRAVANAEDLPTTGGMSTHRDSADHRIEAAAIDAARQQTDTFRQNSQSRGKCARRYYLGDANFVGDTSEPPGRDHFRGRVPLERAWCRGLPEISARMVPGASGVYSETGYSWHGHGSRH